MKRLRSGYTTGACAAAAAKGAALMLRDRQVIGEVEITLPRGEQARFTLHGQQVAEDQASCFVVKEAGDDPDITNGAEIHATVSLLPAVSLPPQSFPLLSIPPRPQGEGRGEGGVSSVNIEGGVGIGRVTKPGLAVPPGEWAINPVPRRMITEVIYEVFPLHSSLFTLHPFPVPIHCILSIPNGELLAQKTLNARLGIIGGLSILGTTGIVRPISAQAWTDSIDAAIDVARACGNETIVLSTGRTSEMIAQKHLHLTTPPPLTGGGRGVGEGIRGNVPVERYLPPTLTLSRQGGGKEKTGEAGMNGVNPLLSEEAFVMMGDHVGHALRACARKGVKRVVLAGQFAKLLKIACGHEQTHVNSSELDLKHLLAWASETPHSLRLTPHISDAATARGVLEASGNDPALIALVGNRARQYAERLVQGVKLKVLLAGYGGEVLYFE